VANFTIFHCIRAGSITPCRSIWITPCDYEHLDSAQKLCSTPCRSVPAVVNAYKL